MPPKRSIAATFVAGAPSGTTIVAGTPRSRAAYATPCAMLPALAVTTPSASSSSVAWRTALPAPRILNEFTGWSVSSLR